MKNLDGKAPGPPRTMRPAHVDWPPLLDELATPPSRLWVTGDPAVLTRPAVAVVGTRRATPRGLAVARGLGRALALRGWNVVSGLAVGVDAAAHLGALEAGGTTVAVMATGWDRTYPRQHGGLRRQVEERGCCLTEFAPGEAPLRHHFLQRNRLIAGLCRGVVVVEAPPRSGALNTAQHAADTGREVFAVPGPVDSEASRGCHRLLRDGAQLLEGPDDVDRVLSRWLRPGCATALPPGRDPDAGTAARWILDRLDLEGVPRDVLRRRWSGTEPVWCAGLLELEMAGLIRRLPGGRLARTIWRC